MFNYSAYDVKCEIFTYLRYFPVHVLAVRMFLSSCFSCHLAKISENRIELDREIISIMKHLCKLSASPFPHSWSLISVCQLSSMSYFLVLLSFCIFQLPGEPLVGPDTFLGTLFSVTSRLFFGDITNTKIINYILMLIYFPLVSDFKKLVNVGAGLGIFISDKESVKNHCKFLLIYFQYFVV